MLFGVACGVAAEGALNNYLIHRERQSLEETRRAIPGGRVSFAQQGEDLVIEGIFEALDIRNPSYVDIGAWDPIICSNTYLFYCKGSRGLLIEPNPTLCGKLKSVRPKDAVLNIGIGVTDQKEADYYILPGEGELNTFSKEEVDAWTKIAGHPVSIKVIKMPLVNINEVLQENMSRGPDLLSVDAEGFDERILKSLDFEKFRPKVICAETSEPGTKKVLQSIVSFLESKDYSVRGSTFVNSIFLDDSLMRNLRHQA
jgi:FkbM family methyltransferase